MELRKKYKWAIDFIEANCGEAKVLLKDFDWGRGLAIALEKGERMVGLTLQRPLYEGRGEDRKGVGLYQIKDTKKRRKEILDWIKRFNQKD